MENGQKCGEQKGNGSCSKQVGWKEGGWGDVRGQGELQAHEWTVPATPLARGQQSGRQDGFKNTTGGVRACGGGAGGAGRAWREVTAPH